MMTRAPEIALCAAWHAGGIGRSLTTVDGQSLEIVHGGAWSHGLGPDFQGAAILFNDRDLRTGSVEMHLASRGWTDHGHHLDHRYDTVILHVVGSYDDREIRRSDGALVPTVDVGPISRFPTPDFASWEWDRIGGDVCAARSAVDRPDLVRAILWRLGDIRIADRAARLEAQFTSAPPRRFFGWRSSMGSAIPRIARRCAPWAKPFLFLSVKTSCDHLVTSPSRPWPR